MKVKVKINNDIYEVSIQNLDERPVIARIGDDTFEVWPMEEQDELAEGFGRTLAAAPKIPGGTLTNSPAAIKEHALKSPLPGTITQISVQPGEAVKQGQELLRLEAMKMNNIIRSTRPGTVSKVHVSEGQQVQHGELLVSIDSEG